MKYQAIFSTLAFCSLALSTTAALAEEEGYGLQFSANTALVSDYVFRGVSQSDEKPAFQGGFDATHESGVYAGIWGSNIDFNESGGVDGPSLEVDVYGGYSGSINDISYDVGVIYYHYPGADDTLDYDFFEGSIAIGYDFGKFSTSASVNYSPEYFGESGDAQYYALNVDVPLMKDLSLSAHVGRQEIDDNDAFGFDDYTDWSLGLNYTLEGFDMFVQYIDTDLDETEDCADGCEERIVFGISRSF